MASAAPVDPWASFHEPWFDTVRLADGLPHPITTALAQDAEGVTWIGTMGGLVRYDGYRVQPVAAGPGDAQTLPDAYVRSLLMLSDGALLVGTNTGGLVRMDAGSAQVHRYPIGADGTPSGKVFALAAAGTDGAWVATDAGLAYLDVHRDVLRHVDTGPATAPRNFAVFQDPSGAVWLGNAAGLFRRGAGEAAFTRITAPGDNVVDAVLHDLIWAIWQDAAGNLWVGSVQRGAVWRSPDGTWHAVPGFSSGAHDDRLATVRSFCQGDGNQVWIGTDGAGVLAYTPGAKAPRALRHDMARASSLPGNAVRALLRDPVGNVWVATDRGAGHANLRPMPIFTVLPSPDSPHALASGDVRAVLVDRDGRVWVGMAAGQLDVIDFKADVIHHLRLPGGERNRDIQALAQAEDGTVWVGASGVTRFDATTLAPLPPILPELANAPVLSLHAVPDGMLVGTYSGVYRYDDASGGLVQFRHRSAGSDPLAGDAVHQITALDGKLWYVTDGGISIAADAHQTDGFINLTDQTGNTAGLPTNLMLSLAADSRGRVWIASLGGLGVLTNGARPPWHARTFGVAEGLNTSKIVAVLIDAADNAWLSTTNGLSVVGGRSFTVRNLGSRDGERLGGYVYAAAARMADGTLLFGGMGGLAVVHPEAAWQPPTAVPLRATRVLVDGAPVQPMRAGDHFGVTLAPRARSLRVDFALLDYQPRQQTTYSYRMEGFDPDWITVAGGELPTAAYTNLPPGNYHLRLRAQPRGLHSREVERVLDVVVLPAWYQTWWAYLLLALLAVLLLAGLVQMRTLMLRRRAVDLQARIDAHTQELRRANARLDYLARTDALTGIGNRRHFLEQAGAVCEAAEYPASVALLDLDRFKRINDTFGHPVGDDVLRRVTATVREHLRETDLFGRYGGEELVLCLPGVAGDAALALAERVRAAVAALVIETDEGQARLTVSIGVAELRAGDSINSWLARADRALYEAKRLGRDRCHLIP